MGKKIRFLLCPLLIIALLNGCSKNEVIEDEEDIFQYKDSYVGDSGAVSNISRYLPKPNGEQVSGVELETTKEPYGIILNYSATEKDTNLKTNYKELVLSNATFILSLVKNADWVKFNFINNELKVSREQLQKYYGKDVRDFDSEEELTEFIEEHLEDKKRVFQFSN